MEIDIFPAPSAKGVHRYIGTSFLGLIIITYIVGAYKIAQQLIGEDKELLRFLVTIIYIVASWHQTMSVCLLQEQQKGVEQSSRPIEHGWLHHKASGGYSKAGNKACSRNATM